MKVKELYHYLKVIDGWENDLRYAMISDEELLVDRTELHKRSEVMPTESNELRKIEKKINDYTYEDLCNLYVEIIAEKEKIYELIEAKKIEKNMSDSIANINKSYRNFISILKDASIKGKAVTTRKETGFVKTENGVGTITYEVETTKTPIYDSKFFIERLDKYSIKADENSNKIDAFVTNEEIDYTPRWSMHSKIFDMLK